MVVVVDMGVVAAIVGDLAVVEAPQEVMGQLVAWLFIASYKLQVTSYKSQVTSYKLQVTSHKLQVTSYKLQVTSFKLQVTSYKLQNTSYKLPCHGYSCTPRINGTVSGFTLYWMCSCKPVARKS